MDISFKNQNAEYQFLIPPPEEGLLILRLFAKKKNGEIDPLFTRAEIERTLEEISKEVSLNRPQTERILKNLIRAFVHTEISNPGKYYLTEYAERFCELFNNKLDSPFRGFPLRKTFEQHFSFDAKSINDIQDFKGRFASEFHTTPRQAVKEHIEELQEHLDLSIGELNTILNSDGEGALQMLDHFLSVFKTIGEKADEIKEVTILKKDFLKEVEKVESFFYKQFDEEDDLQNWELSRKRKDWEDARVIVKDLEVFFTDIDVRMGRLTAQLIYASDKLNDLQETFSNKSLFKINLKKLLQLYLKSVEFQNYEIKGNPDFPIKSIPFVRTQFLFPVKYDFEYQIENFVSEVDEDEEYLEEQRINGRRNIYIQEAVAKWTDGCIDRLNQNSSLELDKIFLEIQQVESDLIIPMRVGFEIIEFANRGNKMKILTSKAVDSNLSQNTDIVLWKTRITRKS